MKRPFGITMLCTALGCLAVVGFANGLFEFLADRALTSPSFGGIAFLYGITALLAAIGLWGMRHWAYEAFLTWVGAAVLTLLYFQFRLFRLDWLPFILFGVFFIALFVLLERYVRSVTSPREQNGAK
jgi:uncharacterized membrane protein